MSRSILGLAIALAFAACVTCSVAQAAVGPRYDVKVTWSDTNLPPGGEGRFAIRVRNVGDETGDKDLIVKDQFPVGVKVTNIDFYPSGEPFGGDDKGDEFCAGVGSEAIECLFPGASLSTLIKAPTTKGGNVTGFLPTSIYVDVEVPAGAAGSAPNTATVSGGGSSIEDVDIDQIPFNPMPAAFGLVPGSFEADVFTDAYPFGEAARQAGAHPFEQRVNFDITLHTTSAEGKLDSDVSAPLKTFEATLPRGLIGNPEATPKCDPVDFAEEGVIPNTTACPPDTQIGYLNAQTTSDLEGFREVGLTRVPLYNLEPPKGTPVDIAFNAGGAVQSHIYAILDASKNYAITAVSPNIASLVPVRGGEVTIWGVPGDSAHDKFRYFNEETEENVRGAPFGNDTVRAFFTNPMDCGFENGGTQAKLESYADPGVLTQPHESSPPLDVTGCNDPRIRFEPEISLQPTSRAAGAPTGLEVHLEVEQRSDEASKAEFLYAENGDVQGIATPPIKKAVVSFPEGMTLSPSAAQGLQGCTSEQIGLNTNSEVRCPDGSRYGSLTLHTPVFPSDAQPEGSIFIAKQGDNPFHNFLSLYLVIEEPERGILVKVPGRLDLNSDTGQITASFDDLPQFPVSDMQMTFKGGVRAGLVNPSTCGAKTIRAEFFSWHDPQTAHVVDNSYAITQKADGSPCVNSLAGRPFGPRMDAGTINNSAGAYSPFVARLTRTDDDQEFSQIDLTLPQGLLAKLAGVATCPDAGIARAISRTGAGEGALEQADPSCPASSLIGATDVGAGVGVPLTYIPGKIYLAGPYRGAPLSVVAITPAVVGPYDLGVVAVRTAVRVNPVTAQASALTDPLPQIYQGIPVRIRDIRISLDRSQFTLNPTSCAEKQVAARLTGTGGDLRSTADDSGIDLASRFQAADCASLRFKPKIAFRLFGGTGRGAHPRLQARVQIPQGGANVAAASVALPRSEFLDQAHIKTVCTRVQFAANQCPPGSIYGRAVAKSPLFDETFTGPVYLRSSSNPLPDLVVALRGPSARPIEVDVVGKIDSINGGIRTQFDLVPDAPVSSFVLTMQGGKKGLLVNSTDLCETSHRATAKFNAQNGHKVMLRPVLKASCGKKSKRRARANGRTKPHMR